MQQCSRTHESQREPPPVGMLLLQHLVQTLQPKTDPGLHSAVEQPTSAHVLQPSAGVRSWVSQQQLAGSWYPAWAAH